MNPEMEESGKPIKESRSKTRGEATYIKFWEAVIQVSPN